jgi:Uma2 family endonuclease
MQDARKLEHYTYEDYLEIDRTTQERVELIFGDIYMMAGASAEHQDVVLNLAYAFKSIPKESRNCTPRIAPYDIKFDINGDRSVVQPDVMLFCQDDALPCAIFEVLSPSTAYKDMTVKKELYERAGVREYFLVNIEHKVVEKFRLDGQAYVYDKTYGADEQMPVMCMQAEIEVDAIFEGIKGES